MVTSRFYNRLLHVSIVKLYTASTLIIVFLIAVWWYFFYHPLRIATIKTEEQLTQMYVQLESLRKSEKIYSGLSQSIDAHNDIKNSSALTYDALSLITECATTSGMNIDSCRFYDERNESWCSVSMLSADLKGSFEQILSFFELLKKSKQIVDVTRCELTHLESNSFSVHMMVALYHV